MKIKIVKIGDPVLRHKTRSLSGAQIRNKKLRALLIRMAQTMRLAQGVGLAANQVGEGIRVFVMESRGNKRYPRGDSFPLQAYLNPKILNYSRAKVIGWEGCLSIPGFRGKVGRSRSVVLRARTPDGKVVQKTFHGFEARVVQHEVDHLNGFFYMDRMRDLRSWCHLEIFNKKYRVKVRDQRK